MATTCSFSAVKKGLGEKGRGEHGIVHWTEHLGPDASAPIPAMWGPNPGARTRPDPSTWTGPDPGGTGAPVAQSADKGAASGSMLAPWGPAPTSAAPPPGSAAPPTRKRQPARPAGGGRRVRGGPDRGATARALGRVGPWPSRRRAGPGWAAGGGGPKRPGSGGAAAAARPRLGPSSAPTSLRCAAYGPSARRPRSCSCGAGQAAPPIPGPPPLGDHWKAAGSNPPGPAPAGL